MFDVSPYAGMQAEVTIERDPEMLFARVCAANGARPSVIRGPRRDAWAVSVRRTAAKVLRDANLSLPAIGRILGGRHHTTVMNLLDPSISGGKYIARGG